jgi:hypothetical protein
MSVVSGQWSVVSLKNPATNNRMLTAKNFNDKTKAISFHLNFEN